MPGEPYQLALFSNTAPDRPSDTPTTQNGFTGEVVRNLWQLIHKRRKFATIDADPPWPYANEASRGAAINHYPTMSLEANCRESVSALADNEAHLHLWTTSGFLREAFTVIEAWGVQYKSCFVWVKPELGCANYWRVSHEFLLLGLRGNLPFREKTQRSWLEARRHEYSQNPQSVRRTIELFSPRPYLEMFGRAEIPNSDWTL